MALIFKLIENGNKLISLILEAKQQKPIQLPQVFLNTCVINQFLLFLYFSDL